MSYLTISKLVLYNGLVRIHGKNDDGQFGFYLYEFHTTMRRLRLLVSLGYELEIDIEKAFLVLESEF